MKKIYDEYITSNRVISKDWSGKNMKEKIKQIDDNNFNKIYFAAYRNNLSEMVHGSVVGVNSTLEKDEGLSMPICTNHCVMNIMNNFILATNIWDNLAEDVKDNIKELRQSLGIS